MDSLTQIVLGGTLAAALVPQGQRRRALVYGAALGTLPDLDVLVGYGNAVADFTYHRSYSHSLIVLSVLAPLLWLLARRFDRHVAQSPGRWLLAFWLALITHPLLDAMTIYGTQLWWPLDNTPIGVGSIFIIDPLYTLPLLIAMIWVARRPLSVGAGRSLPVALALSSAYLGWSALAQAHIAAHARADLGRQLGPEAQLVALPSAFNTVLWRILVREPGGYREAYYSLLADHRPGPWRRFPSADHLTPSLTGQWAFERLRWFTHGYYAVRELDDEIRVTDLRMGSEPAYVFSFAIARREGQSWAPIISEAAPPLRPVGRALGWLVNRMVTPGQAMEPPDVVLGEGAEAEVPAR
ncbi:MAG: metal-dependent hydrolase [Lysobacterales bacterium]